MALNQKRKPQEKKPSRMKTVKTHGFVSYSDDLLGGVVRESLNGIHFAFDSCTRSIYSQNSFAY